VGAGDGRPREQADPQHPHEQHDKLTAADMARRVLRQIGEGGGHRTKAGGFIKLETGSEAEVERLREKIRRRYLRSLGIKGQRGQKLVPNKSAS
jgi:hypothetical protein